MSNAAEILNRVVNAGTMNSYGSRFTVVEPKDGQPGKDGDHLAVVKQFELKSVFNKKEQRQLLMIGVDFVVAESNAMSKGASVSDAFMIGRVGTAGETACKKANGLARAMIEGLGHVQDPADTNGEAYNKLVFDNLMKMLETDPATTFSKTSGRKYPGRGIVVRVRTSKSKADANGKIYDNNTYSAVTQTMEQVKAARAVIEAPPAAAAPASKSTEPAPPPAAASAAASMLDDI